VDSFLEIFKQMGPTRVGVMGIVVLGLLVFFVFMSLRVSTPQMELLYSDLSTVDSSTMAARLEEAQIRYRVSPDGSRIMAPEDEIGRARMLLAQEGLPNGGSMGYELFDTQTGFGTTNFVQNVNQVRALQGELARTISSLEAVRSARVLLVLPEREMFSRESRAASASVYIGLRPGARMDNEQVLGVQSLVASAVPNLKPSDVTIIDQDGTLLARGGEDDDSLINARGEEMRMTYERTMARKIEELVGKVVGYGNVQATVTAELNFDRVSTNEELFDPETQVVRSSQTTEENNLQRGAEVDGVTIENNLPGVGGDALVERQPSEESNRVEEVTNYEISRTVRTTTREVGEVSRLSVSVLVDGRYTEGAEGEMTYEPRSEQEIEQIRTIVRSAVGFDDMRGDALEVVNMQFAEIQTEELSPEGRTIFGFDKDALLDTAEVIVVAIMIILVVLLVLQPMVGRLLSTEGPSLDEALEADMLAAREASPQLAAPSGDDFIPPEAEEDRMIDMQRVEGKVKASSVKRVEDLVDNYPSETVSVIRSWMSQET
jgi:flagellar M-ring protein FliF